MTNKFLQKGDVIEIEEGHRIYADVPMHFVFSNCKGCYDLTHHDIIVHDDFAYFAGKYVVIKTSTEGGGTGHGNHDVYPNGHKVWCVKVDDKKVMIDFFQSGCFTAMIKDIKPVGKAKLTWTID